MVSSLLIFELVLVGIALGSLYSLAALGIVLIYRTTGVLNFAHGAIAMFTAFVAYQFGVVDGWPMPIAVVLALIASTATAVLAGTGAHERTPVTIYGGGHSHQGHKRPEPRAAPPTMDPAGPAVASIRAAETRPRASAAARSKWAPSTARATALTRR